MAFKSTDYEKATYKARGKIIEIPNLFQSIEKNKINGKRFVARFRYINNLGESKIKTLFLGFSIKDKLTPRLANKILLDKKQEIDNGVQLNDKIKLDEAFSLFLETLPNTRWTKERQRVYNLYIKDIIGKKQILDIKTSHIKRILSLMDKQGLAPNTQKKVLAVMKPLFKSLIEDGALKKQPYRWNKNNCTLY